MAKQQKEELPLFDDFTEDSLFDQLEEEEETPAGGQEDDDNDDDDPKGAAGNQDDDDLDDDDPAGKGDSEDDDDDDSSSSDDDDDDEPKPKGKKGAKDAEDEEDLEETPEDTFWSDVEKLTGRQVEVDYGEADPESPEGAAIREEALVQSAINDHLDYLSKIYPREFRALEHAANGGSIEDLYNPAEPDFSKIQINEKDVDAQKGFMENYYQRKGFSADKAKRLVEADEDNDELFKASTDALKELSAHQEKERNKIAKEQEEISKRNRQQDMQMVGAVEKVVQSGKLNKFTIPVKEREEFYQFALQHMQRNPNGGYMFVQPVDPQDLEKQLQEMFFTYKKGDLSSIVQREVKTEGARRLKRNANKGNKKKGSGGDDARSQRRGALPTMDDYSE